jgi:hypothetical protein
MKAILVRVGVDHSYGNWNAPADPDSRRFVYVPIPEKVGTRFHRGCKRSYHEVVPTLSQFASEFGLGLAGIGWPKDLEIRAMHLDPDFDELTYGDVGNRRGAGIRQLDRGDLVVFYAGLRPIRRSNRLIYALVGMLTVDDVVLASSIPKKYWARNAHTRKVIRGVHDIVVRGIAGRSGRFRKFLPIGEFRDRAYRVRRDLLRAWGGLTVTDGFLQRSATPPHFVDALKFQRWLDRQDVELMEVNNEQPATQMVIFVHLRRPERGNAEEMRTDPLWEFGSFGCTGCHARNLMNPRRAHELAGARLAFAQGGPLGFRLVKLTPPIEVTAHSDRTEVRWSPPNMPFRYVDAPLLIDNEGWTDFPRLAEMLASVERSTWEAAYSSRFRSRRTPLPDPVASEIVTTYERMVRETDNAAFARTYDEALPYPPLHVDRRRRATYKALLADLAPRSFHTRCRRRDPRC